MSGVTARNALNPKLKLGMHRYTLPELHKLTVVGHPDADHRQMFWDEFAEFFVDISRLPVHGEIWIAGSFMTDKLFPNDIDVTLAFYPASVEDLNDSDWSRLEILITHPKDHIHLRTFDARDPHGRAYWRGMYGWDRDGEISRGIAVIDLGAQYDN